MIPIALPDVGFKASYPKLNEQVSTSKFGERSISFVEWGDPFWIVDISTVPLKAAQRLLVEVFARKARGGMQTILYIPTAVCLPQAYWGQADHPALSKTGLMQKLTNDQVLDIIGTNAGLKLTAGDYLSLTTADFHSLHQVVAGGTANAGGSLSVSVWPPVMSYIEIGAVVTFKNPKMNARIVPGSFAMSDEHLPTATWQLTEVPR